VCRPLISILANVHLTCLATFVWCPITAPTVVINFLTNIVCIICFTIDYNVPLTTYGTTATFVVRNFLNDPHCSYLLIYTRTTKTSPLSYIFILKKPTHNIDKKILMLHFYNWKKNALWSRMFVLEKLSLSGQ
jgi:hypothetical protein